MADRDWEKELAEIDQRLASVPDAPVDEAARPSRAAASRAPTRPVSPAASAPDRASLGLAASRTAPPPVGASDLPRRAASPRDAGDRRPWRTHVALLLRLVVGLAVAAALVYWPYATRCGVELAYYLGLVAVLGLAGLTTAASAWRHRAPGIHLAGLAMLAAAAVLGAREVLPKTGYAYPSPEHPVAWTCS